MKRYIACLLFVWNCGWLTTHGNRAGGQESHPADKIKAVRTIAGTCVDFERGDYLHAVIRTADGKSRSFFVIRPELAYFLAAHRGQPLSITYQMVDTYIPEAGDVTTVERISAAKAGTLTNDAWWQRARRTASPGQLRRKYESLLAPPPAAAPFYFGEWKVIGYKAMPISGMSDARTRSWLGRKATYNPHSARFHDGVCNDTHYLARRIDAADFVRDYRLKPADLGMPAGAVEIVEVDCSGHPFESPGGILIRRTDGRMLTFWAGVFFILERQ